MMQTLTVEVSSRRVATVLLNRPDRGNAFDQTMLDELGQELKALAAEEGVRIVVLRGSGRHFCTGADLAPRAPEAKPESSKSPAPNLSLRGSTQVYSDTQLSIWVRHATGGMANALRKNPYMTLMYRDPPARTNLTFEGRAEARPRPHWRGAHH